MAQVQQLVVIFMRKNGEFSGVIFYPFFCQYLCHLVLLLNERNRYAARQFVYCSDNAQPALPLH